MARQIRPEDMNPLELTTDAILAIGNAVALKANGNLQLADAAGAAGANAKRVAGFSPTVESAAADVKLVALPGTLIKMLFDSTPGVGTTDDPVYLSETPGKVTLTPPSTSGSVIIRLGHLAEESANPADVVYDPAFVAEIP